MNVGKRFVDRPRDFLFNENGDGIISKSSGGLQTIADLSNCGPRISD
jgi:hypothetical protein